MTLALVTYAVATVDLLAYPMPPADCKTPLFVWHCVVCPHLNIPFFSVDYLLHLCTRTCVFICVYRLVYIVHTYIIIYSTAHFGVVDFPWFSKPTGRLTSRNVLRQQSYWHFVLPPSLLSFLFNLCLLLLLLGRR